MVRSGTSIRLQVHRHSHPLKIALNSKRSDPARAQNHSLKSEWFDATVKEFGHPVGLPTADLAYVYENNGY